MLDGPEDLTAFTRWVLGLFWPLRSRAKWGEPLSFAEIHSYLAMKGFSPNELFEWFCLADSETVSWMNEETIKEQQAERRKAQVMSEQKPLPRRR